MSNENPENVDQKASLSLVLENAVKFLGGLKMVSGSLTNVGMAATQTAQRVAGMISPLNVALSTGIAAFGTAQLVGVNSAFEQLQLKMAQTLRFIGVSAGSFDEALADAATMINRIESSAARLPGEAEDYTVAMSQAGVHVNRAVGDFDRAYSLIEKMTAVGISIGHSGAETAMLLERALDAQKGMLDQGSMYAQSLMNAMRNLPEYAHMTVAQFNNLKLEKRAEIMERVVGQYDDMISAAGNTWDSIAGAAATTLKTVARLSGVSLFEGVKNSVSTLTAAFQDGDGKLTHMAKVVVELGNLLGGWVGAGLERMAGAVAWIGDQAMNILGNLDSNPIFQAVDTVVSGAQSLFSNADTIIGDAITIFKALWSVVESLVGALQPAIESVVVIASSIWSFFGSVISITATLAENLKPALDTIANAIGAVVSKILDFMIPVVAYVGDIFIQLYETTADWLVPAFEKLAELVTWIAENFDPVEAIAAITNQNADMIRAGYNNLVENASEESRETARVMREGLADFLARINGTTADRRLGAEGGSQDRHPPAHRGGGKSVQDFRYSRFEIQQKFEEGFDPDRIATAFASDIGRIGEQRLQSGFEPLFGVR